MTWNVVENQIAQLNKLSKTWWTGNHWRAGSHRSISKQRVRFTFTSFNFRSVSFYFVDLITCRRACYSSARQYVDIVSLTAYRKELSQV